MYRAQNAITATSRTTKATQPGTPVPNRASPSVATPATASNSSRNASSRARARTPSRLLEALNPALLLHQVGEGERAGVRIVPPVQVQPLDRHQDAVGQRVPEVLAEQPAPVGG